MPDIQSMEMPYIWYGLLAAFVIVLIIKNSGPRKGHRDRRDGAPLVREKNAAGKGDRAS